MASIYNAWLPDLAKDKLIAQIPEAMGTEVKADWPAGVVGASSTGGALYGFPNEIDLYALNYNKKLFEAAGIAAPPANWDELIADAKKLSDKSKGQQGFGMINSWTAGVIHPFAFAPRLQWRPIDRRRQASARQRGGEGDLRPL